MLFKEKVRLTFIRFIVIYAIGFILTFPFPYNIMPDIGGLFSTVFEPVNQWWIQSVFQMKSGTSTILSDTTGLYVHLINLSIISLLGTILWWLITKWQQNKLVWQWFHISISYYLALTLLIYGFNKVFKFQFFFPEPNTLFTPLGQLTPDILYWSTIGTSYQYSLFSGLIEVVPAILLLFRKTRLLGGIIALMVIINIVMINFGFDISVKVYSLFLFLLAILIISPHIKPIINFLFKGIPSVQNTYNPTINSKSKLLFYSIGKPLIIGLIFLEVLLPYFESQNFNDDLSERPYLYGAYTVKSIKNERPVQLSQNIKHFFIHRKQYFILQYSDDQFESFRLEYGNDFTNLKLTDSEDRSFIWTVKEQSGSDQIILEGLFRDGQIKLTAKRIKLEQLPVSGNNFHWTIDSY